MKSSSTSNKDMDGEFTEDANEAVTLAIAKQTYCSWRAGIGEA